MAIPRLGKDMHSILRGGGIKSGNKSEAAAKLQMTPPIDGRRRKGHPSNFHILLFCTGNFLTCTVIVSRYFLFRFRPQLKAIGYFFLVQINAKPASLFIDPNKKYSLPFAATGPASSGRPPGRQGPGLLRLRRPAAAAEAPPPTAPPATTAPTSAPPPLPHRPPS